MKDFIKKNNSFWNNGEEKHGGGLILVEELENPFIVNILGGCSVILNRAKSYEPLFMLKSEKYPPEFFKSYVSCAKTIKSFKLCPCETILTEIEAFILYLSLFTGKKILDLKYDDILIGDIVYDMYLTLFSRGTIKKPDLKVLKIIRKCIRQVCRTKNLLKKFDIKAGLFSHAIGISSGITSRTLLRYGREVFTTFCMPESTISRLTKPEKRYQLTPTREEIENIKSLDDETFNALYEEIFESQMNGVVSADASNAFNPNDPIYRDREHFAKDFGLDPNKKNIFVMAHAFNDHPHSHYNGMIFNDYADWFFKTLEYAKKDDSVNWLFKRHPSDRFYPARDIDWDKEFSNLPKNIVLFDDKNKLNSKTLHFVADAVITCAGSAGFENAAMAAIPCVTAGDSPYGEFNFNDRAFSKEEYFQKLSKLKDIEKLSPERQKTAKAFYIFTYKFSRVPFDFVPNLSFAEQISLPDENAYWKGLTELWEQKGDTIRREIKDYAQRISKDDFRALRTIMR